MMIEGPLLLEFETEQMMKKLFAIFFALAVIPSFHAHAWVGGPFDNNNFTPEGDDGIYEAVATLANGVGLYRWGVGNRATAAAYTDTRQGNTGNVQFGAFQGTSNQHTWYFEGNVYYGTCFGTVNGSLGTVQCVGNAADLVPTAVSPGVLAGPGLSILTPGVTNQIVTTFNDTDGDITTIETQTSTVAVPNEGVLCNSFFSATTDQGNSNNPAAKAFAGQGTLFVGSSTTGSLQGVNVTRTFLVFGSRVSLQRNG